MTHRVPDFFIVGQPKTGTTALYAILRCHPQIYMPDVKEPQYFADEMTAEPPPTDLMPTTRDQYLSLFAPAAPSQLIGDASTLYLWSRTAARNIALANPDARIIMIFREPADFLRSLHLQLVKIRSETEKDLRRALALEDERWQRRQHPTGGYWTPGRYWTPLLNYSEHMRYMDQLDRYRDVFSTDQLLILIYDDFRHDNRAFVCTILRFLGVSGTVSLPTIEANQGIRLRSRRAEQLVDAAAEGRGTGFATFKTAVEAITTQRVRRAAQNVVRRHIVYGKPQQPEHDLVMELRRRYKPEVEALAEYLGRDLTKLWGYNEIARHARATWSTGA